MVWIVTGNTKLNRQQCFHPILTINLKIHLFTSGQIFWYIHENTQHCWNSDKKQSWNTKHLNIIKEYVFKIELISACERLYSTYDVVIETIDWMRHFHFPEDKAYLHIILLSIILCNFYKLKTEWLFKWYLFKWKNIIIRTKLNWLKGSSFS